jgi:hypothetical protein
MPAIIPVSTSSQTPRADMDVPYHPSYNGVVLFKNTFDGQLEAIDYPKVNVCASILIRSKIQVKNLQVLFCHVSDICCIWSGLGLAVLEKFPRFITSASKSDSAHRFANF